ncbi:MAG: hypothetical protein IJ149_02455 [Oscillospiraceae bacterium]|nr:hypothetical protein [Oscillospiraceae bacterium]
MSKTFRDHLIITFPLMLVCWGLCIILGFNGITKADHLWINIPYVLGAFSTTIASYITLKKNNEVKDIKYRLKNVFDLRQSALSYIAVIILVTLNTSVLCLAGGYEKKLPCIRVTASVEEREKAAILQNRLTTAPICSKISHRKCQTA